MLPPSAGLQRGGQAGTAGGRPRPRGHSWNPRTFRSVFESLTHTRDDESTAEGESSEGGNGEALEKFSGVSRTCQGRVKDAPSLCGLCVDGFAAQHASTTALTAEIRSGGRRLWAVSLNSFQFGSIYDNSVQLDAAYWHGMNGQSTGQKIHVLSLCWSNQVFNGSILLVSHTHTQAVHLSVS